MSVRGVGDSIVVEGSEATRIHGAHGVVAEHRGMAIASSLVDPPRLALRAKIAPQTVALVDVATGEIERYESAHPFSTWFDREGALCGFEIAADAMSFVRIAEERASLSMPNALPFLVDAHVDAQRGVLIGRHPFARRVQLVCVRPWETKKRLAWRHSRSDGIPFVVATTDRECVVVTTGDTVSVEVRALDDARLLAAPVDVDAIATRAPFRAVSVALDASSVARVALLTRDGHVTRFRRDGDALRLTMNASANIELRALPSSGERTRAMFDDEVVAVDTAAHSASMCFARGGVAVAIVDGSLRRLFGDDDDDDDESDEITTLEGPTNVVAIAPHPRGVVALTGDGRATVVDVARGAR